MRLSKQEMEEIKNRPKKRVIIFWVIGVYEDDSEDCFEEFATYEDAERYILATTYEAKFYRIDKVWADR